MATILVIEDEFSIRDIVTELLESCDMKTISAEHPDQVEAGHAPVDLVLADLVEQQSHGFESDAVRSFVQQLRERFAAPVVLFTAHSPSVIGDPRALGAAGLIGKPFDVDDFAQRINLYLQAAPLER